MIRRKVFCFLIGLLIILYFLDLCGVSLVKQNGHRELILLNQSQDYHGIVTRIQCKETKKYVIDIKLFDSNGRKKFSNEKIRLVYYDTIDAPWDLYRAEIKFSAILEEPTGKRNPHCFDYEKYLKSVGVSFTGTLKQIELCQKQYNILEQYQRFLLKQRMKFEKTLSPKTKGVIIGILFGDTSYLDDSIYDDFRKNGTAHILAVSGLHVGILYGVYQKLVGKRSNPLYLFLLAGLLLSYGILSMWSPSTIRAVGMIALSVFGRRFDLRYDMLTAMSTVAIVLILFNPYVIFGASFQMSFLAITSIAFFRRVIPRVIPDFLLLGLSVYAGLLLYQIEVFHYVSVISLIANLPMVYLTGYFVPFAIGCFLLYTLDVQILYQFFLSFLEAMARVIISLNQISTIQGYSAIDVVRPPLWLAIFITGTLFFCSSETFKILKIRKRKKMITQILLGIFGISMIFQMLTYSPITHADLIFVDVGQGDCIHLRSDRKNILIDGGGNENYNVGNNTLKQYFLGNGVRKIDMALVTHLHTDHFLGQNQLNEVFTIDKQRAECVAGEIYPFGEGVWMETLWPLEINDENNQDANDQCSVFLIHLNGYRILITGDIDIEGENQMISYYCKQGRADKLRADILKVGHHGSKNSTSEQFLQVVQPQIAIIQVGKNTYGHPSEEAIDRLSKNGCKIYRNDLHGAIGLTITKKGLQVHTMEKR